MNSRPPRSARYQPRTRARSRGVPRSCAPGYTLLELLMVMGLVGVLSASALPALRSIDSLRAQSTRDQIIWALTVAREHASASGRPIGARCDLRSQTIMLVQESAGGRGTEPLVGPGGVERAPFALSTPGSARITRIVGATRRQRAYEIWFFHEGAPTVRRTNGAMGSSRRAPVTIWLSQGSSIIIDPVTGVVR